MGKISPPMTGGCLCGSVRYRATSTPFWAGHCHCQNCRRHSGASFATDVMFHTDEVSWLDEQPTYYKSSDRCERGFCSTCGSTVSARYFAEPDVIVIAAGTLDDANLIEPVLHAFTSRRVAWVKLNDGLPEYPEAEPVSGIEV